MDQHNAPEGRSELTEMRDMLREFVRERDWSRFHSPKNLASALSVEASELLEPFTWLASGDKSELDETKLVAIRHEMADVLAYLVMLADSLDVDLHRALIEKMALNRAKYPADMVRGDARKYSEYKAADNKADKNKADENKAAGYKA
ncbi:MULTISPECIES: nucleotide pyrophosphohydrolase [unclassified Caballeronia]|uniref:nucleotide pyrophosphohydrolase n=1 Tax=unclassified Caballeronia TaxID=2646786 RepID=UPI001FD0407F|nr:MULTISPECIES: nucleotide pyrophosphohydrolase [unclassified Caballeronia]